MTSKMKFSSFMLAISLIAGSVEAETMRQLAKKSQDAATTLMAVVTIPDRAIPKSLLERATCVATVPDIIRAGFVFGVRYGKGLVSCRTADGWSQPSFIEIVGGSWGLQIGVQSLDLVLVFMRPNAVAKFSRNNFTLGLDATVAAGPLGRDAQIGTDYRLNSEIYSYSRAEGLFAGLTIEGTAINVDKDSNAMVYGDMSGRSLLRTEGHDAPSAVSVYVEALMNYAK